MSTSLAERPSPLPGGKCASASAPTTAASRADNANRPAAAGRSDTNQRAPPTTTATAPKPMPASPRAPRNDLRQSLEYLLEAYTDLLVTGEDESQRTYFKFLAKVRVSQSFQIGDIVHKHLVIMATVRPMIQEKFREHQGDGL